MARRCLELPMRFPIPMRGNEPAAGEAGAPRHLKFPIPMRGNEDRDEREIMAGQVVSDPHEG